MFKPFSFALSKNIELVLPDILPQCPRLLNPFAAVIIHYSPPPHLDLDKEVKLHNAISGLINKKTISSAHDLSDGGLAVNIAESVIFSKEGIAAEINFSRKLRNDELLFGECQSVIIISITEENLCDLIVKAQEFNVHTQTIGKVVESSKLKINDLIEIDRDVISDSYFNSFEKIMEN